MKPRKPEIDPSTLPCAICRRIRIVMLTLGEGTPQVHRLCSSCWKDSP